MKSAPVPPAPNQLNWTCVPEPIKESKVQTDFKWIADERTTNAIPNGPMRPIRSITVKLSKRTLLHRAPVGVVAVVALLSIKEPVQAATVTPEEAHAIAVNAYLYFYPLVTMDITR